MCVLAKTTVVSRNNPCQQVAEYEQQSRVLTKFHFAV